MDAPSAGSASFRDAHGLFSPTRQVTVEVDRPEEPVAWVNGIPILRRDLAAAALRRLEAHPGGLPPERMREVEGALQAAAFQDLVVLTLLRQEARARPAPSEAEVDEAVARLSSQTPPGRTFGEVLASQGLTLDTFRSQVADQVRVQRRLEERIGDLPVPTDEEVELFFVLNQNRFQTPERVTFRHLLIRADRPGGPGREEARRRAEALRVQVAQGADMAALVRDHSEDPGTRAREGLVGPVPLAQLPPPLALAFTGLPTGEVAPVVDAADALHVVRIEAREPPRDLDLTEATPLCREILLRRRRQEALEKIIQTLVQGAEIRMAGTEGQPAP